MDNGQFSGNYRMLHGHVLVAEFIPREEEGQGTKLKRLRICNLGPGHSMMLGTFIDSYRGEDREEVIIGDLEHLLAPGDGRDLISVSAINKKIAEAEPEEQREIRNWYETADTMMLRVQVLTTSGAIRIGGTFKPMVRYPDGFPHGNIGLEMLSIIEFEEVDFTE